MWTMYVSVLVRRVVVYLVEGDEVVQDVHGGLTRHVHAGQIVIHRKSHDRINRGWQNQQR